MADRTCAKCGKVFTHPCRLKAHERRKTPCSPIVEQAELPEAEQQKPHMCKFCGHRFSTAQGLSRHRKNHCTVVRSKAGMDMLYEHTRRKQQARGEALLPANSSYQVRKEYLEDLERQMSSLSVAQKATLVEGMNAHRGCTPSNALLAPPLTFPGACSAEMYAQPLGALAAAARSAGGNQNIVGSGIQLNQQIQINVFGEEMTPHIGRGRVKEMLDGILRTASNPGHAALQALIETALLIYSDPDHPENITCYLPDKERGEALVHVGGEWAVRPCELVLPPMVSRSLDTLVEKQPFDDAERYGDLMKALIANEQSYKEGHKLKTVLVRNRALLEAALYGLHHCPPPT